MFKKTVHLNRMLKVVGEDNLEMHCCCEPHCHDDHIVFCFYSCVHIDKLSTIMSRTREGLRILNLCAR